MADPSRALAVVVGVALTVTVGAAGIAAPAAGANPNELLVSDQFSGSYQGGWGLPDVGDRWMFPAGTEGFRVASGKGVMAIKKRGAPRLTTVNTSVQHVTSQISIGLDRLPGGSGVKVMAVARKSAAGEYRVGVRIGEQGKIWLSTSKVRGGGDAKTLGEPVAVTGLRYRVGSQIQLKAQVVKQDPTQIRAKVWEEGSSEPARWQLLRNDSRNDVGAGGRVGVRAVLTDSAGSAPIEVQIDDIHVTRASNATRVPTAKPAPAPTPKPANVVNVPSSIDSSGGSDVADELQSVIDKAPDGSTIVFRAGGRYRLGKAIRVRGKRDVTLDGNGARLDLPTGDKGIRVHDGSTGTTIRDLTLVGNNGAAGTKDAFNSSRQSDHGIAVYSADDTLIENVDIRRVWGDCLYVNRASGGEWSHGVTLRDSSCRLTGRHGVGLIAATRVRIVDNVFDEIGFIVVDIEPYLASEGADDVVIRGNDIGSYSHTDEYDGWVLAACGKDVASVISDVTVTGNTVEGNAAGWRDGAKSLSLRVCGDDGRIRKDFTVTGNVGRTTVPGPAMSFTGVRRVTVTGNTQPLSKGELASFPGSSDVTYDG